MSKIEKFTELNCWKISRELCTLVYSFIQKDGFSKDWKLRDQINGSSGSIMDNIAEGFERGGTREFIQFLSYAKGSAGEVKSQLYRAIDRNYITNEEFNEAMLLTENASKTIQGLMSYLQNTDLKGTKYSSRAGESAVDYETLSIDLPLNIEH